MQVQRVHVRARLVRQLVVGVIEALVPEERDEAPVTKPRHARMLRPAGKLVGGLDLRLADGEAHVIRRTGALLEGIHHL